MTGGTGMIGRPLVDMLLIAGAKVTVVSLDDPARAPADVVFKRVDLREFKNCVEICKNQEIVFNLVGVKGSPAMTTQRPATFFVPTISCSVNMMEAARVCHVDRFLFTSSIGVYAPAPIFHEADVWKTFPSPNDRFAGWAKRICELQAEAYKIEYGWDKISIVRPANVYGPYDNFDPENAMVIPSLIRRALNGENPLSVWGDGSPVRDFIFSTDVAKGMMLAVEKAISEPFNLGSGVGVSIKDVVELITNNIPNAKIDIHWDIKKPAGDKQRLMDMSLANSYGFHPTTTLSQGIRETIYWYIKNMNRAGDRYNAFLDQLYTV